MLGAGPTGVHIGEEILIVGGEGHKTGQGGDTPDDVVPAGVLTEAEFEAWSVGSRGFFGW